MNTLQRITRRVKELRRKHPSANYHALQRRAAKELKGKKVHRKAKKAKVRRTKSRRMSVARKRSRVGFVSEVGIAAAAMGSIAGHKSAARNLLKHRLGKELVARELAPNKTKRKRLTKKIAKTKKAIRSLC